MSLDLQRILVKISACVRLEDAAVGVRVFVCLCQSIDHTFKYTNAYMLSEYVTVCSAVYECPVHIVRCVHKVMDMNSMGVHFPFVPVIFNHFRIPKKNCNMNYCLLQKKTQTCDSLRCTRILIYTRVHRHPRFKVHKLGKWADEKSIRLKFYLVAGCNHINMRIRSMITHHLHIHAPYSRPRRLRAP